MSRVARRIPRIIVITGADIAILTATRTTNLNRYPCCSFSRSSMRSGTVVSRLILSGGGGRAVISITDGMVALRHRHPPPVRQGLFIHLTILNPPIVFGLVVPPNPDGPPNDVLAIFVPTLDDLVRLRVPRRADLSFDFVRVYVVDILPSLRWGSNVLVLGGFPLSVAHIVVRCDRTSPAVLLLFVV
jgi:hypothetical protein